MQDDDLKKLLCELKSENEPSLQESMPPKSRMSLLKLSGYALGLAALGFGGNLLVHKLQDTQNSQQVELVAVAEAPPQENDEEELEPDVEDEFKAKERAAALWAQEIVKINPAVGKNVHLIWDMLKRRKADLEDVADELWELLTENATFREDFYGQNATLLLSRYQALDARHSTTIANQINATYAQIERLNNSDLKKAYSEMLGELSCEMYTTYQFQIAKQQIMCEMQFDSLLSNVVASKNLASLDMNLALAEQMLHDLKNDGLTQTFSSLDKYQERLAACGFESINHLLFDSTPEAFSAESRASLESILTRLGATSQEKQRCLQQLDQLADEQNQKKQETVTPATFTPVRSSVV